MSGRRALLAYFLLAFAIPWAGVLLLASRTGLPAPVGAPQNRNLVLLAMLAGPALASILLTALAGGRLALRALARRLGRWRIGLRWYAALLFAPAVLLLTLGLFSFRSAAFAVALWLGLGIVALAVRRFASCRATSEERTRPMSGDALVPAPKFSVTHAITVNAAPERVWPWLVQMGSFRAGWYSWDRIDNGGRASAAKLLPEHQRVARGDVFPALPGEKGIFVVESLEPLRDIVLTVPGQSDAPIVSWEHRLEPLGDGRTRLLIRGRVSGSWKQMVEPAGATDHRLFFIERVYQLLGKMPDGLLMLIGGAGHRVMEARHMRGIKRRAEARA